MHERDWWKKYYDWLVEYKIAYFGWSYRFSLIKIIRIQISGIKIVIRKKVGKFLGSQWKFG